MSKSISRVGSSSFWRVLSLVLVDKPSISKLFEAYHICVYSSTSRLVTDCNSVEFENILERNIDT